jgi:hypothetical protein
MRRRRSGLTLEERLAIERARCSLKDTRSLTTMPQAMSVVNRMPMPALALSEVEEELAAVGWTPGCVLSQQHLEEVYLRKRNVCLRSSSPPPQQGPSGHGNSDGEDDADDEELEVFRGLGGRDDGRTAIDLTGAIDDARRILGREPLHSNDRHSDSFDSSPMMRSPSAALTGADSFLFPRHGTGGSAGPSSPIAPPPLAASSPVKSDPDPDPLHTAIVTQADFACVVRDMVDQCGAEPVSGTDGRPIVANTPRDDDLRKQLPSMEAPHKAQRKAVHVKASFAPGHSGGHLVGGFAASRRSLYGSSYGGGGASARSSRSSHRDDRRSVRKASEADSGTASGGLDDTFRGSIVESVVIDRADDLHSAAPTDEHRDEFHHYHDADSDEIDDDERSGDGSHGHEGESASRALMEEVAAVVDFHRERMHRALTPAMRTLLDFNGSRHTPAVIASSGAVVRSPRARQREIKPTRGTAPSMVARERAKEDAAVADLREWADREAEARVARARAALAGGELRPPSRQDSKPKPLKRASTASPTDLRAAKNASWPASQASPEVTGATVAASGPALRYPNATRPSYRAVARDQALSKEEDKFVWAIAQASVAKYDAAERYIQGGVRRTRLLGATRQRPNSALAARVGGGNGGAKGGERIHTSLKLRGDPRDDLRAPMVDWSSPTPSSKALRKGGLLLNVSSRWHRPVEVVTHGPTLVEVLEAVALALAPLPPGSAVIGLRRFSAPDPNTAEAPAATDARKPGQVDIDTFQQLIDLLPPTKPGVKGPIKGAVRGPIYLFAEVADNLYVGLPRRGSIGSRRPQSALGAHLDLYGCD